MSTIYREICNYAVTKDGKAYFLNFDYLKNSGFGYSNTIYTKDKKYTTEDAVPFDDSADLTSEGEYLPCLGEKDFTSLIKGKPTDNMKIILNANKIPDIKFDKVVSFYFKFRGLKLIESFCNIFWKHNIILCQNLIVRGYDGKTFDLKDFAEAYLIHRVDVKQIS